MNPIETFALCKRVSGYFTWNRGAWSDKTHLPKKDVDELWQLIEGCFSEDTSDFGDAWIVIFRLQQVG